MLSVPVTVETPWTATPTPFRSSSSSSSPWSGCWRPSAVRAPCMSEWTGPATWPSGPSSAWARRPPTPWPRHSISTPSTVTRQVTALVGSALVARRPNPSDGRSSTLSLTSEGRRTMHEVEHERQRILREILGDWDEAERAEAARVLTRLNGSLVDKFASSGASEKSEGQARAPRDPRTSVADGHLVRVCHFEAGKGAREGRGQPHRLRRPVEDDGVPCGSQVHRAGRAWRKPQVHETPAAAADPESHSVVTKWHRSLVLGTAYCR
jgi:hypothetical protein